MIREETKYLAEDGTPFESLQAAERHQATLDARKKANTEQEIRKVIYCNLFKYIQETGIGDTPSEDMLDYLVTHKKDIIKLLTDGNLDTVYRAPRSFEKT